MTFINALPGAIAQGLIWGLMAIGLYITYKVLDFADLTVDGSMVTGAVVFAALFITNGVNIWVALLVATLAGAIAGLMTGVFHTIMGIPPILAGILTQLSLWSINLKILGQSNMAIPSRNYDLLISNLDVVPTIFIMLSIVGVIILGLYWFFGTKLGCSIRATGCNENMSRAQGINTKWTKIIGLMLSNAIVALSGALLAQLQGAADINMGRGAIVIGLAAVIIGTAIVSKISENFAVQLVGVALGGIIYYIVYTLVIALGLDTDLLKLLSALIVAIFLAIPYLKKTYFDKPKKLKTSLSTEEVLDNPENAQALNEEDGKNA